MLSQEKNLTPHWQPGAARGLKEFTVLSESKTGLGVHGLIKIC